MRRGRDEISGEGEGRIHFRVWWSCDDVFVEGEETLRVRQLPGGLGANQDNHISRFSSLDAFD